MCRMRAANMKFRTQFASVAAVKHAVMVKVAPCGGMLIGNNMPKRSEKHENTVRVKDSINKFSCGFTCRCLKKNTLTYNTTSRCDPVNMRKNIQPNPIPRR